jgi:signal transduction histidine kinase
MYGLITALIIYRGANSGVLYLIAPTLLVVLILFQHAGQALKVHIGIFIFLTGLLFIYAQVADPVKPYSPIALKFIYPFNLATSLGLLIVLARFFFKLNNEYQRELLAISDTKTRLMAVIGHDLRGPINSLLALLDLAKQKAVSPEEFERLAGRLHQNTQEVHQTLNNLLNWSLTQLEGIKAVPAKINVAHACSSVADLYQQIADKKSIKILLDIKPELYVWCDEEQIKLILRNLLSNAIKYSQENSQVVISAKKFTTKVTISIADTGIGMSQQQLASILEPSLKSSKMGTKGEAGTGLGLMLVQEMVSLNNGKLSVSSQPNQGTVFTVSLPWPKTN